MIRTALLIAMLVVAPGAQAFEGKWQNSDAMSVAATISKDGSGPDGNGYRVKLETGIAGCGGEVEGPGEVNGNVLTMTAPNEDKDYGRTCIVTLTKKGKRLVMEEIEGCLYWHGAACEFSGTMSKKR